jgi:hypothetical protein
MSWIIIMEPSPTHPSVADKLLGNYLEATSNGLFAKGVENSGAIQESVRQLRMVPIGDLAAACTNRNEFDLAVTFLDADFYFNAPGSRDDHELAKAGLGIVDPAMIAGKFEIAEWALNRAAEIFQAGTAEQKEVQTKRSSIEPQISAARKLGTMLATPGTKPIKIIMKNPVRTSGFESPLAFLPKG